MYMYILFALTLPGTKVYEPCVSTRTVSFTVYVAVTGRFNAAIISIKSLSTQKGKRQGVWLCLMKLFKFKRVSLCESVYRVTTIFIVLPSDLMTHSL
jgi:hypothetical protein